MSSLFGMIRAMQLIVMSAMIKLTFPPIAQTFFLGASVIASMDVFEAENKYENIFVFKETEYVSEKFNFLGTGDKNFTMNSGSLYVMFLLIIFEDLGRKIINRIVLMCKRVKYARRIGAYFY